MKHIHFFGAVGMSAMLTALMAFTLVSCQNKNTMNLEDIFHFTALEDNLQVAMLLETDTLETPALPSLLYSLDGKNWETFIPAVTSVKVEKAGDRVYFKANNKNTALSALKIVNESHYNWYTNGYCFTISAKADVGGDIMYLLDGENPSSATMGDAAFACLFSYCEDKLIDASKLILPAAKLTPFCFFSMFGHCSNLIAAPELPATELARYCYDAMFSECSSLVNAPSLPAAQLADYCYQSMFTYCKSLKYAPELPAEKLAPYCYDVMFMGSAIETAPQLPATNLAESCYFGMFAKCLSLVNPPTLPATELEDFCYGGMFLECTSLVEAPSLPARELIKNCYSGMFFNCSSLIKATVMAEDLTPEKCVHEMFGRITTSGTLTAAPGVDWTGVVPATWTVE